MKVAIAFSLTLLPVLAAAAPGIDGEQFLPSWQGNYEVTQCLQCPDVKTDHSNLKNFSNLSFYSFPIPAEHKLGCAQTDFYLSWGPDFRSPDGSGEGIGEISGECNWGFDEFLHVTPTTLEYKTLGQNPAQQAVTLSLTEQADGSYLIDLKEDRKSPEWGFPLSFELKAVAKKTN